MYLVLGFISSFLTANIVNEKKIHLSIHFRNEKCHGKEYIMFLYIKYAENTKKKPHMLCISVYVMLLSHPLHAPVFCFLTNYSTHFSTAFNFQIVSLGQYELTMVKRSTLCSDPIEKIEIFELRYTYTLCILYG